ncbi:TIGR03086 family metal-binding protein [Actinocorallia longicatena]|uniref:Mycothiol-dependent maleylpyruvate isomerase metal-binding domain-containing protein n=1 Tax=Actinocorallia longicatena TaxID=111803 RepID=A0ABP6QNG8_9ACTN
MKFIIMGRVSEKSETGALPDDDYIQAMHDFNAELNRSGVLLATEGLYPSSMGARIAYTGGKGRVVDGPFTESKELIAGFWIIDVTSKEEALAWALRLPVPADAEGEGLEIRQIFDPADLVKATDARAALPLLDRALDQMAATIAAVDPVKLAGSPTPCTEWNVEQLVGHIVDEVGRFAEVSGGQREHEGPLSGDWPADFAAAARSLRAAWARPQALEQVQRTPIGEIDALWAVKQQCSELVGHTWDLAKAADLPLDLDPELTELALTFMTDNIRPEMRGPEAGGYIGLEVPADPGAPPLDRLIAFSGRDPGWRP